MKVPSLRQHATGQFFVRWGGKDHYLGHDKAAAEENYWRQIEAWKQWREEKKSHALRPRNIRNKPVVDIAEQFFKAKRIEVGHGIEEHYRKHLARFLHLYGDYPADWVRPRQLNALKVEMIRQGYAPRTINHDMTAVRVLYNWASGLELVNPVNLKGVKNVPVGPAEDHAVSLDEVRAAIRTASEKVRPWMAVNYLAMLRPSEVVKVVHGEGKWVDEGVFRLDKGKMDKRAAMKRHCIFSPVALAWLEFCEPHWSRLDTYSSAVRKEAGVGPKALQKSGASHLITLHGAAPADVELLLGHVPGRLSVTYYRPSWQRLRDVAAKIGLGPHPGGASPSPQ